MPKNQYTCDCRAINDKAVERAKSNMPNTRDIESLSMFYKMLSDGTRCKIICALSECEMCVCDIACLLNMTKSAVSHQLSKMRESGVVKCRREGKEIYYSLDDAHVSVILELSLTHIRHKEGEHHG